MRILWQGFVDPRVHGSYVERLLAYLRELADEGTEFEMIGLQAPDVHIHRITEARCAAQVVSHMLEAEHSYDAIIMGHFQDSGLWDARSALEVPVIGLGETSMLHACTLGYRIGLVTIDQHFVRWHEEQVTRYRLQERVVAVRAMDTTVQLFMDAFEGGSAYDEVRDQFEQHARALVDQGVEVVIPAGGLPALLFRDEQGFDLRGAVVLNPTAVAAKHAEMAVRLHRLAGVGPSRFGTFALASEAARREWLEQIPSAPSPAEP